MTSTFHQIPVHVIPTLITYRVKGQSCLHFTQKWGKWGGVWGGEGEEKRGGRGGGGA